MKMSIQGLLERSCLNAIVSIRPFSNVSTHTTGLWEGYAYSIFDRNNIEILLFPMCTSKTHLPTGTPSRPKTFGMACLFLFPPRIRFFSYFFFSKNKKVESLNNNSFQEGRGGGREILLKGRRDDDDGRQTHTHKRRGRAGHPVLVVADKLSSTQCRAAPVRDL